MALATGDGSGGAPGDAGDAAAPPPPPPPVPSLELRPPAGVRRPCPSADPPPSGSPRVVWADIAEADDVAAGRPVVCQDRVPPRPRRGCCPTTPVALLLGVGARPPVGRAGAGVSLLPPLWHGGCKVWPWVSGCPPGGAALAAGVLPAARTVALLAPPGNPRLRPCPPLLRPVRLRRSRPSSLRPSPDVLPSGPSSHPAVPPGPSLRVASPPRLPLAVPVRPRRRPPRRRSGKP
ncbi:basic proline-rich protein-like [Triticum urartu]|uniref:basic proline-rich protein-like n=1 Tax=Triticum urartu TaxID=4572 RepID=UPI0020441E59|nr:basic proline-rich protein-like [Triticum urartu]